MQVRQPWEMSDNEVIGLAAAVKERGAKYFKVCVSSFLCSFSLTNSGTETKFSQGPGQVRGCMQASPCVRVIACFRQFNGTEEVLCSIDFRSVDAFNQIACACVIRGGGSLCE